MPGDVRHLFLSRVRCSLLLSFFFSFREEVVFLRFVFHHIIHAGVFFSILPKRGKLWGGSSPKNGFPPSHPLWGGRPTPLYVGGILGPPPLFSPNQRPGGLQHPFRGFSPPLFSRGPTLGGLGTPPPFFFYTTGGPQTPFPAPTLVGKRKRGAPPPKWAPFGPTGPQGPNLSWGVGLSPFRAQRGPKWPQERTPGGPTRGSKFLGRLISLPNSPTRKLGPGPGSQPLGETLGKDPGRPQSAPSFREIQGLRVLGKPGGAGGFSNPGQPTVPPKGPLLPNSGKK